MISNEFPVGLFGEHKNKTLVLTELKLNILFLAAFLLMLSNLSNAQTFDGYALYSDGGSNNAYLIDENGMIEKAYEKVKPKEHALEVLSDII